MSSLPADSSSKLDRYFAAALVLSIPTIPFVRYHIGDFQVPLALVAIAVYACLKLPVLKLDSSLKAFRPGVTALLSIFLVWSAASVLWASTTDLAVSRLVTRSCNIFFCILVINFCPLGPVSTHRLSRLLPLVVLIPVIIGYYGYFTLTNPPHYQFSYEFPRLLGDRNSDTFMILTGLPFALAMFLTGTYGRIWSLFGLSAFLLMALAIFLSLSRWNLLVMIFIVTFIVIVDLILKKKRARSIVFVVAVCISLPIVVSALPTDALAPTVNKYEKRFDEVQDDNRWGDISAALELAGRHPVIGVGVNNFPPQFHTTDYGRFWYRAEKEKPAPHNSYLGAWAELGTPGLIVFTAVVFWPLVSLLRLLPRVMRSQDPTLIHMLLGSLGLSWVLILGIVTFSFADIFFFWIAYAIDALVVLTLDRSLRHTGVRRETIAHRAQCQTRTARGGPQEEYV